MNTQTEQVYEAVISSPWGVVWRGYVGAADIEEAAQEAGAIAKRQMFHVALKHCDTPELREQAELVGIN